MTLTNAEGEDVTDLGTFFAGGEALESNKFSTTESSLRPVSITAEIQGVRVGEPVNILASDSYKFPARALLEDITRTSCDNCPTMIKVIESLSSDNPQTVIAYNVHNSISFIYQNYYAESTRALADSFCTYMGSDLTAAPKTYINRATKNYPASLNLAEQFRQMARESSTDAAIALETETPSPATVEVTATIGTKKSFSGKIVAVLVDNGLTASQSGMGEINMFRVIRDYQPSLEGQAASFEAGKPLQFSATFDLSVLNVTSVDNCEVIVFVTDDADGVCEAVQYASIGEAKGY